MQAKKNFSMIEYKDDLSDNHSHDVETPSKKPCEPTAFHSHDEPSKMPITLVQTANLKKILHKQKTQAQNRIAIIR